MPIYNLKRKEVHPPQTRMLFIEKKAREFFWQTVGLVYVFCFVCVGIISTTFYIIIAPSKTNANFHVIYFFAMFSISTFTIIALSIYIWKNRNTHFICEDLSKKFDSETRAQQISQIDVKFVNQLRSEDSIHNQDRHNKKLEAVRRGELPIVSFEAEGFNVYYKAGLTVFLVGSIAMMLINIIVPLLHDATCYHFIVYVTYVVELAFLISQAVFIFCNDKAIFLKHRVLIKIAFAQLFTTNMCLWAYKTIGEVRDAVSSTHSSGQSKNATFTEAHKENPCKKIHEIKEMFIPFLNPAMIEYTLLVTPMILEMMCKIGDKEKASRIRKEEPIEFTKSVKKAWKGIIVSAICLIVTVAVITVVYNVVDPIISNSIYVVQDITLHFTGIVLCGLVLKKVQRLKFVKREKHTFDDRLLFISSFGSFLYVFSMMATLISGFDEVPVQFQAVDIIAQVIALVQISLQTIVVLDGLRRRLHAHSMDQPGKTLVTALLGLNIALWLMDTFEVRKIHHLAGDSSTGTTTAIRIVVHVTLPLAILFRFHSSVCFSTIWTKGYSYED